MIHLETQTIIQLLIGAVAVLIVACNCFWMLYREEQRARRNAEMCLHSLLMDQKTEPPHWEAGHGATELGSMQRFSERRDG